MSLQVGAQCSHPSCSELDFLPIFCRCNRYYCRHHAAPDLHQCPVDPAANNPSHLPFEKLQRCEVQDCNKPSLNAFGDSQESSATCPQCKQSFCAYHRHPISHACAVQEEAPPQKNDAARALLAKNFPASSSKKPAQRVTKIPSNPVKLAQYRKVELMKMRHRAVPGDPKDKTSSTPLDQRLHIRLKVDPTTEKVFWFRKTMIIGKVLDCLASHAGMKSSDAAPLQLLQVSDTEERVLRNDTLIVNEVEEGDTLAVGRIISSA